MKNIIGKTITYFPPPRKPRVLKDTGKYRIVELEEPKYSPVVINYKETQIGWNRILVIEEKCADAMENTYWREIIRDRGIRTHLQLMPHNSDFWFDLLLGLL